MSMIPTLQPGDWAVAIRARRVRRGDVAVVQRPGRPGFDLVKRVVGTPGDPAGDGRVLGPNEWWIEGDWDPGSTDSRQFGPVGRDEIKGKIVFVYWPKGRRRIV